MWKIKHIFDGDYGCEEHHDYEGPTVSVTLVSESGETRLVSVADAWLREKELDIGDMWPLSD